MSFTPNTISNRGAWSSAANYGANDAVQVAGVWYVAVLPSLNQTPPNVTYWIALVASGLPTPLGTSGQLVLSDGTESAWGLPAGESGPLDPTLSDGDLIYRKYTTVSTLGVGGVGDSIMAGTAITTPPLTTYATTMTSAQVTVTGTDNGVSGTTSADWVSGSTNLIAAKTAFAAAGVRLVLVMLGTNDAKTAVATSAAAYRANILSLVEDLIGAGYLVSIQYPPYLSATTGSFDAGSPARVTSYCAQIATVRGMPNLYLGDTLAYSYFKSNSAALQGDGVHPTQTGSDYQAGLWAAATQRLVNGLSSKTVWQRLTVGTGLSIAAGVISTTGGGGGGQPLMQNGVTFPPVPLTTEAGDDWLISG